MRIDRLKFCLIVAEKDITLTELSKVSGISRQTISAVRQGKRCSMRTAKKIADALEVDLSEIMEVR